MEQQKVVKVWHFSVLQQDYVDDFPGIHSGVENSVLNQWRLMA